MRLFCESCGNILEISEDTRTGNSRVSWDALEHKVHICSCVLDELSDAKHEADNNKIDFENAKTGLENIQKAFNILESIIFERYKGQKEDVQTCLKNIKNALETYL